MKIVKPEVNLIAYTRPVEKFQRKYSGTDIETFVVALARSTRTTEELNNLYLQTLEDTTTEKNIKMYMALKHFTVFEFIDFTFEIKGISRACSHELVRHRTATYLQQSQRHIDLRHSGIVVPPKINGNEDIEDIMFQSDETWRRDYIAMIDYNGVALEDARFVAPNSVETRVIMKIDGRNLLHFLKLRMDKTAMWEIRDVANLMWMEAIKVCPYIFDAGNMDKWV